MLLGCLSGFLGASRLLMGVEVALFRLFSQGFRALGLGFGQP